VARFEASEGASLSGSNPLRHPGSRQDIANMVLFLVSDAARFVNGQVIAVDGGSSVDAFKLKLD
jgi:3-oxoacyl-[acyl-carrier protein] reductase